MKFYIVAMLFVIFDIEVVFLYPWAVSFKSLVGEHATMFLSMASFVFVLLVAYIYALKKRRAQLERNVEHARSGPRPPALPSRPPFLVLPLPNASA